MEKLSELRKEQYQMLADCVDRESRMTEWEGNFVESLTNWLDSGRDLTPKQAARLEELWERVTKGG